MARQKQADEDAPLEIDPAEKARWDRDRALDKTTSAIYYLTPREREFVNGVCTGMEYSSAAEAAGYKQQGRALINKTYTLMRRPIVRAAIYQTMSATFGKANITTEQTLRELSTIAFMPDHMLQDRPRYSDKLRALELLAKYQRMLDKFVHVEGEVSVVGLIVGSARREKAKLERENITDGVIDTKTAEPVLIEKVNGSH